ncbi:hypothetical protein [Mycolicibacterium celeriflavum]|uniref:hypothetical protein n=1 Tax=Mycolicibacterium celeriflavum TaxID=1249101 RepID=UPI000E761B1C|nr:hypothetical protein [Mycolicibacterium celeriflavum]
MAVARRDAVAALTGVVLVVAAFGLPRMDLGVLPVINVSPEKFAELAGSAPLHGWWEMHVGIGTASAIVIGFAVVLWGPTLAQRLHWRTLIPLTWATACAWAFSLAMVDGWARGFAGRLTTRHEYVRQVATVDDVSDAVRGFAGRILDFQPDSWITHVSGHPPGALLTFVWLDRLGLGGGAWAAVLCLLVGSSAAAAIVVAVRALADETMARSAAPFVAVAPTAIWVAVSADGYFAGVTAWALALLAVAVRREGRMPVVPAAAAGLLLGWAVFLSYGLALMALPVLAVLITATNLKAAVRVLLAAVLAALLVAAVFLLAGFWWFEGYQLVQQRYWQGTASDRPFQYWGWANLAAVVCAVGLAGVAGAARAVDVGALRRRAGLNLVVVAMLVAILCADLSMLSKAEVERIWLPFTVWLPAAAVLLPSRSHRWWLALNVAGALVLNHVLMTTW